MIKTACLEGPDEALINLPNGLVCGCLLNDCAAQLQIVLGDYLQAGRKWGSYTQNHFRLVCMTMTRWRALGWHAMAHKHAWAGCFTEGENFFAQGDDLLGRNMCSLTLPMCCQTIHTRGCLQVSCVRL